MVYHAIAENIAKNEENEEEIKAIYEPRLVYLAKKIETKVFIFITRSIYHDFNNTYKDKPITAGPFVGNHVNKMLKVIYIYFTIYISERKRFLRNTNSITF